MKRDQKKGHERNGQSTVEYTFCMIIVVLLLVGMIEVFSWMARDLVMRRHAHESVLAVDIGYDPTRPFEQITPYFFTVSDMQAVPIMSNIYGGGR